MDGILGILGIFFVPAVVAVLIVFFVLKHKRKQNELRAELYAKAIEKGMELPADLFATAVKKRNYLNSGIICIAVGLGIGLFFVMLALLNEQEAISGAPIGVIPFLIGVAYLFIHYSSKKKSE
jgi:purine-cytosine permease-like protein